MVKTGTDYAAWQSLLGSTRSLCDGLEALNIDDLQFSSTDLKPFTGFIAAIAHFNNSKRSYMRYLFDDLDNMDTVGLNKAKDDRRQAEARGYKMQ
ncbi:hypothetical protein ACVRXQ_03570 [Streptococcus panodentis]|uniref:Uncharacterized protein n=1 Tax=Streptococcus panodentis TaxID=1581472 RepID=A0ABS5AZZ4_9STRE|nr:MULTISPECIES: hypothetical protein [Streptococcus]KXT85351.1 hypothetical protein STRDD11_00389 [Streptococcus sp. DD11]MBP2621836.1 hypothetical protein [Streptococcus panodentis]